MQTFSVVTFDLVDVMPLRLPLINCAQSVGMETALLSSQSHDSRFLPFFGVLFLWILVCLFPEYENNSKMIT